jgi:hypothetical protein
MAVRDGRVISAQAEQRSGTKAAGCRRQPGQADRLTSPPEILPARNDIRILFISAALEAVESVQGPGCVKTPTSNFRVERLSR